MFRTLFTVLFFLNLGLYLLFRPNGLGLITQRGPSLALGLKSVLLQKHFNGPFFSLGLYSLFGLLFSVWALVEKSRANEAPSFS